MARVQWAGCLLAAAALGAPAPRLADAPKPVVGDKVKERFTPAPLDRQKIQGWLGERMRVNLEGRLLHTDQAALLAGFQKRPGNQAWVGEHVGKFLNAAALTWAYTGDARLKAIMDRTAHSLIAAQLPDGYLGTYTDAQRWTGWDVWVHKYDLIGLLSYYEVTGDPQALQASRKIGDLLASTFGDGPGQRDLIKAGAHVGMAATSVLGPICTLYRYTGEQRYLDFARYIVRADDQPDGPNIIRSLTQTGSVLMVGDAKARELLSNLAGLLDLYQLTGDETLLTPALAAWKDITAKRLYITGTASVNEFFKADGDLPGEEGLNPGEGSVTATWIELNAQLLRITGEASYAEEIERTVFNGLLGAQDPHNGSICPYLPLVGKKRPTTALIGPVSSVPCGIARLPQLIWGVREGGVAVALYAPGEAAIPVRAGLEVTLRSETRFPADGAVSITVLLRRAARFPVFLRVPAWCTRFVATVKDAATPGQPDQFLKLERVWQPGDAIRIEMDLPLRIVPGGKSYPDYVAFIRGPQVLALEGALNPQVLYLHRAAPRSIKPGEVNFTETKPPAGWSQAYTIDGSFGGHAQRLVLVPFADAVNYRVWLVKPDRVAVGPVALTAFGRESWSRAGTGNGSICDERSDTYRTTFQPGKPAKEDWYAVEMDRPADIARIVFRHGKVFENGGWFDTSAAKPIIQVKRTPNGEWETVATLDAYPSLDASQVPRLRDGEPFAVRLQPPVRAVAIRIAGKPARLFSSCAELAAYDK